MNNSKTRLWTDELADMVRGGLMAGLTYSRLVLNHENFSKTSIRKIMIDGVEVDILEGWGAKNFLIDMSKAEYRNHEVPLSLRTIEAVLKDQGVIKEIEIECNGDPLMQSLA